MNNTARDRQEQQQCKLGTSKCKSIACVLTSGVITLRRASCVCAQVVAPKRAALAEANRKLDAATRKLSTIRAKVQELNDRVKALEGQVMKVRAFGSHVSFRTSA